MPAYFAGAFLCVSAGAGAAAVEASFLPERILRYETPVTHLNATVERAVRDGNKVKLYLRDLRYDDGFERVAPAWGARLSAFESLLEDGAPLPGTRIYAPRATLRPLPLPVVPGGYDFAFFMLFERIGAVGFFTSRIDTEHAPGAGVFAPLRDKVYRRITAAGTEPAEEGKTRIAPAAAVSAALLTGERGAISDDTTENMRRAGLSHLLAISGMHVGIVTAIGFFLFRRLPACIPFLAERFDIRRFAAPAALAAAFCYVQLTGAPVSAQRALFMAAVFLTGLTLYRRAAPLHSAGLAALCMCFYAPHLALHPGFRMSFGAVVAIIGLFSSLERYKRIRAEEKGYANYRHDGNAFARAAMLMRKTAGYFAAAGLSSLAATAATTAFSAYHFHRFSLLGILANCIAVPLTALWIMPAGAAALVTMPLGAEAPFLALMFAGVNALLSVAAQTAGASFGAYIIPAFPEAALFFAFGGVLLLFLTQGRLRYASLPAFIIAFAMIAAQPVPDIFIGENGKSLAVNMPESGALAVNGFRAERYARERRAEASGKEEQIRLRDLPLSAGVTCRDDRNCTLRLKGRTVLAAASPGYAAERCARGDIDIFIPLSESASCEALFTVSFADLAAQGAHALYLPKDGDTPYTVSVAEACRAGCPALKARLKP